jgi:hypothetical protein
MSATTRRLLLPSLLLLACSLAIPAQADTWTEVGDAHHLIPQTTAGTGPLDAIIGDHVDWDPVDLYCIKIISLPIFQAWVNCAGQNEYDLILFDENFNGIALTDDCTFSTVQLTSAQVPSNGIYYLGHSSPDSSPFSSSGLMWISQLLVQDRAPDGPGAANPLTSWALGNEAGTPYTINLLGCEFCDEAVPTETATWGDIKSLYRGDN